MSDDFLDLVKDAVIMLLVVALAIAVAVGLDCLFSVNYCDTMEDLQPEFNFKWVFWGGCMVQTPSGYWINAHHYQYQYMDANINP